MNKTLETSLENKPLFSIIMPCYNSEDYINRSVQSCLNQTFSNWELIIINDGSTDNTLNIINSFIQQDNRIRVFSKENGGYVSAVNYALDYVKGKYFMFLGSDDEVSPSLFSDIFEQLQTNKEPDLIGFRALIKKTDNTTMYDEYSKFTDLAIEYNTNIKDFSTKYSNHSEIFFIRDTCKLFKTELLESLRYFGKKGMDADGIFSMLFAHKASSFLSVPTVGYIWYLRTESLSGRKQDYETQIDRINNWISFGNEIILMNPMLITKQEKFYLISHFYSIVESLFLTYHLNDQIIKEIKIFLEKIISFLGNDNVTKEIKLFMNHTILWKYYIRVKTFSKKMRRRIKNIRKKIRAKIKKFIS